MHDCDRGNSQVFSHLFNAQSPEELHFNDAGLSWIRLRETDHCVVERQQFREAIGKRNGHVVKRDLRPPPSALRLFGGFAHSRQ